MVFFERNRGAEPGFQFLDNLYAGVSTNDPLEVAFRFFVQWPAGAGFISPGPTGVLGRAGRQLGFSNNNDIQADRS